MHALHQFYCRSLYVLLILELVWGFKRCDPAAEL